MTVEQAQSRVSVVRRPNLWLLIVSGAVGMLLVWCAILGGAFLLAQQSDQGAVGQEQAMNSLSDSRPDWSLSPDDSRSPGLPGSPADNCVDVCLEPTVSTGVLVTLWLSFLGSVRPARRDAMRASPFGNAPRSSLEQTAKDDHQPDLSELSVCIR